MSSTSKEANLILALRALQNDKDLSVRAAAKMYNVNRTTLAQRRAGRPSRRNIPANSLSVNSEITTSSNASQSFVYVFLHKYGYQRAKCENQKSIREWFALVHNTKAKYGILDEDSYNFDKTGFMMGGHHQSQRRIPPSQEIPTTKGKRAAKERAGKMAYSESRVGG